MNTSPSVAATSISQPAIGTGSAGCIARVGGPDRAGGPGVKASATIVTAMIAA